MPINGLVEMEPGRGHHPEAVVAIVRHLSRPAPEGQVHVLGALDGCVAAVTARANPELAASRAVEAIAAQRRQMQRSAATSSALPPRSRSEPGLSVKCP